MLKQNEQDVFEIFNNRSDFIHKKFKIRNIHS